MNISDDELKILRKIEKYNKVNQRALSKSLGISLGKINYCLKELRSKGYIKISNFKQNKNKINYIYLLTPKGIKLKTRAILNFMKIKIREYEDLKNDL